MLEVLSRQSVWIQLEKQALGGGIIATPMLLGIGIRLDLFLDGFN